MLKHHCSVWTEQLSQIRIRFCFTHSSKRTQVSLWLAEGFRTTFKSGPCLEINGCHGKARLTLIAERKCEYPDDVNPHLKVNRDVLYQAEMHSECKDWMREIGWCSRWNPPGLFLTVHASTSEQPPWLVGTEMKALKEASEYTSVPQRGGVLIRHHQLID